MRPSPQDILTICEDGRPGARPSGLDGSKIPDRPLHFTRPPGYGRYWRDRNLKYHATNLLDPAPIQDLLDYSNAEAGPLSG